MRRTLPWAAVAAAAFSPSTSAQELEFFESLSISTRSDLLEPLPGTPVRLIGNSDWQLATNAWSQTPVVRVEDESLLTVVIGETESATGSSVGQAIPYAPFGPDALCEGRDVLLQYNQPFALHRILESSGEASPQPYHSRWSLVPADATSDYEFASEVATLLTPEIIEAYFTYHGVPSPAPYDAGVLLRFRPGSDADSLPDFGTPGAILTVDVGGYAPDGAEGTGLFSAYAVHMARDIADYGTSTLQVTSIDLGSDLAAVQLQGALGVGDNLVLLSFSDGDSGDGIAIPMLSNFDTAWDSTDGSSSAGSDVIPPHNGKPCEPEVKPPGDLECEPSPPKTGKEWEAKGKLGCTTETKNASSSVCLGERKDPVDIEQCFVVEGGSSVGGEIDLGGATFTIKRTGKTTTEYCRTEHVQFGKGAHGCGQCWRTFYHIVTCKQGWKGKRLVRKGGFWNREYVWEDTETETACVELQIVSKRHCDMECE